MTATASEVDRLLSHVIKGPGVNDCWFWVGAIGDDGYGRFWIRRDGNQRAVRPQRFLFEHIHQVALRREDVLMHLCDVPLCVHVDADPLHSHLALGTHASNMRDRSAKGRHGNDATVNRMRGISRRVLAARSRAVRTQLLEHGWDPEAIAAILIDVTPEHPTLF